MWTDALRRIGQEINCHLLTDRKHRTCKIGLTTRQRCAYNSSTGMDPLYTRVTERKLTRYGMPPAARIINSSGGERIWQN